MTGTNPPASVQARLLNRARSEGRDYSQVLTRYGLERLLYRLSISAHAENFLLKGALLFDLWFDVPLRPTRDIDLLGFGLAELPHVMQVFREICEIGVGVDDGVRFDPESVTADEIRNEASYAGIRVKLEGRLGQQRCPVQIDIGYGDAVTPEAETAEYPVLLENSPAPVLRVYPKYTVVAEKLEAIITLGLVNTRMKDYFDLWVLSEHESFDYETLATAIRATLRNRQTQMPSRLPLGLSDEFSANPEKRRQWAAFLSKNRLISPPLESVVERLRNWLVPAMHGLDGHSGRTWIAAERWYLQSELWTTPVSDS